MTPDKALERLKNPVNNVILKAAPFAAVLTCSDPRLCPELLFDCGPGELFVVRTAGHVLTPEVEESLALALHKMQIPLILILGHEGCAAIKAAEDNTYPNWSLCKLISGTAQDYSKACQKRLSSIQPFQNAIEQGQLQIQAAYLSLTDQAVHWL